MNAALITLLRAFYWVILPIYFILYALAMRGDSHAAFWFEGGSNEFGPYSFYILILCWLVPVLHGVMLSIAGHKEILSKTMQVALVLSVPCIPGFLLSSQGQPPVIVPHLSDYFARGTLDGIMFGMFFFGVCSGIGVLLESLFSNLGEIETTEIVRSCKVDNEQLWTEHQQLHGNHDKLKMLLNEFGSGSYSSSSEFFALLMIAGKESYNSRLPDINSKIISELKRAAYEYKLGRFTSPNEYESFSKKYHSDSLPYDADVTARKITHPLLIKMYNAGDALKARAIAISENKATATAPQTTSSLPLPTTVLNTNLAISRNGQVFMQDVPRENVQTLIMQGTLRLTDHYWANGMSNWLPLSNLTNDPSTSHAKSSERSLASALLSLLISWLITVVVGVFVLGLIGYGNSGADGAGRLIGTYIGLLIFVRPIFLVIEIISRAIMGKRGVDLLAP